MKNKIAKIWGAAGTLGLVEVEDTSPARSVHARFQLEADAETGSSGIVIAGTKLKIGIPIELEGSLYRVNGVVSGVSLP